MYSNIWIPMHSFVFLATVDLSLLRIDLMNTICSTFLLPRVPPFQDVAWQRPSTLALLTCCSLISQHPNVILGRVLNQQSLSKRRRRKGGQQRRVHLQSNHKLVPNSPSTSSMVTLLSAMLVAKMIFTVPSTAA